MRRFLILIAVCCAQLIRAQPDNSSLMFNQETDTTHEKEAFFKIQNLNYLKNNEYYGYMADGYTQFGIQLNPQLGYQLSKNLSIEAGVFLSKDFGNKNFNNVDPTFSLRYHKKDFKMIFGNLDGSLNHRLIEPLYNFERLMTNRLEGGLQFMIDKRHCDFDVWADWQNMIYRQSNGAEKIWAGLSGHPLKLKHNRLEFKIPFQVTILHSGGQIDTSSGSMSTNWNFNGGTALTYTPSSGPFQQFIFDARYVGNVHYLFTPAQSEKVGSGVLANAGFTAFNTDVLFSYWYGYRYLSDYGGYLYSSQSSTVYYSYIFRAQRSLLILRLTKRIRLADRVNLTLRAEPYYDFFQNLFEYSFGFYISLDERIWLKKKQTP
jgi:hypothetical protein